LNFNYLYKVTNLYQR